METAVEAAPLTTAETIGSQGEIIEAQTATDVLTKVLAAEAVEAPRRKRKSLLRRILLALFRRRRRPTRQLIASAPGEISLEEKRSVYKAMMTEAAPYDGTFNWYTCRNGHPYFIGECTGAVHVSHCAECGARIGGVGYVREKGNDVAHLFIAEALEKHAQINASAVPNVTPAVALPAADPNDANQPVVPDAADQPVDAIAANPQVDANAVDANAVDANAANQPADHNAVIEPAAPDAALQPAPAPCVITLVALPADPNAINSLPSSETRHLSDLCVANSLTPVLFVAEAREVDKCPHESDAATECALKINDDAPSDYGHERSSKRANLRRRIDKRSTSRTSC